MEQRAAPFVRINIHNTHIYILNNGECVRVTQPKPPDANGNYTVHILSEKKFLANGGDTVSQKIPTHVGNQHPFLKIKTATWKVGI